MLAFATPSSGNPPLTVTFTAAAADLEGGTITSYVWNFGDGTAGSGATAPIGIRPTGPTSQRSPSPAARASGRRQPPRRSSSDDVVETLTVKARPAPHHLHSSSRSSGDGEPPVGRWRNSAPAVRAGGVVETAPIPATGKET